MRFALGTMNALLRRHFEWQALHVYVLGTAIWSMNLLTQGVSVVMNAVNNMEQPTGTRKYSVYYQELSK